MRTGRSAAVELDADRSVGRDAVGDDEGQQRLRDVQLGPAEQGVPLLMRFKTEPTTTAALAECQGMPSESASARLRLHLPIQPSMALSPMRRRAVAPLSASFDTGLVS